MNNRYKINLIIMINKYNNDIYKIFIKYIIIFYEYNK